MDDKIIFIALSSYIEILRQAHQVLPKKLLFEIYHHQGKDYYNEVGTLFIKVVNHEYCKSYGVLLPGQHYPAHFHRIKKETFFVLYGDLTVVKDDDTFILEAGDMLDVERLEEHSFSSEKGCVFEEISTTYMRNDSVYLDSKVYDNYNDRKTIVKYDEWRKIYKNETGKEFFY